MRTWASVIATVLLVTLTVVVAWHRSGDLSRVRSSSDDRVESVPAHRRSLPAHGEELGDGRRESRTGLLVHVIDPRGQPLAAIVASVRADADGRAEILIEPGIDHELDIQHDGYGAARIRERLAPGERRERVVRLYPGRTVIARVEGAESGRPVQGASLTLYPYGWTTDSLSAQSATTDSYGLATWENVPIGSVTIESNTRTLPRTSPYRFELRDDIEPLPIVIELSRVQQPADPEEAAEPDEESRRSARDTTIDLSAIVIAGRCLPPQPAVVWIEETGRRTETTKDGQFVFRKQLDLPKSYTLKFKRPGPFQVTYELNELKVGRNVELRFPPGGELAVRCLACIIHETRGSDRTAAPSSASLVIVVEL